MASRRLSASDSLMWRIEADPVLRSPVLVVGLLDRPPKWARLRAAIDRAAGEIPGLRQRLAPPRFGIGRPTWCDVEAFSLDHHLRRIRARRGQLREVFELAEPDAAAPFDRERPLWSLTVVEGLDGGAAAFVLRFHHSITDGVGALRLAHHLLDPGRRASATSARSLSPSGSAQPVAAPPLAARVAHDISGLGRAAVASVRDPSAAARRSLRMARSVRRLLQPAPGAGSPLLAGRGIDRALRAFEVPLGDLRRAAAATGGTVNDVLLAAVGGAFRAYHQHHDTDVATLRVSMPVDRRRSDDPAGGNRFTPTRFVLPVDDPDPATRARIAGAIVRSWRSEPALGASEVVASGLDLLPGPAVTRVFGGLMRDIDVNVVDLRGLDGPAFLAGGSVERLWAFAPTAGTACSVTLLSHADVGCVAVTCDSAAIRDPDLLTKCLEAGFDEVLAIGGEPDLTEGPA